MIEIKNFSQGKLNSDVDENMLNPNDWIDALNIHVGSPGERTEGVVTQQLGNRNIMPGYSLPSGINKIIGAYPDTTRNRVYCFLWNSNGSHRIFFIDTTTETATDIFKNLDWTGGVDLLKLDPSFRINDINIIHRDDIGDIMYWVQNNTPPRKINVLKGQNAGTSGYPLPIVEDFISVAKTIPNPPDNPTYVADLTTTANTMKRKLFQFRYRWIYDDLEKSPWGGWSKMPIPSTDVDPDFATDPTWNAGIVMSINSGGPLVTKIEISVRQNVDNAWGDPFSFEILDKADQGIADNVNFSYTFKNSSAGTPLDAQSTSLLFTAVPMIARTQELVNGNTLLYGNTTEGLDFDEKLDVSVTSSTFLYAIPNGPSFKTWKWSAKYRLGLVYYDPQGRTDGVHTYVNQADDNDDFVVQTAPYMDDGTLPFPSTPSTVTDSSNPYVPNISITIRHQPPTWATTWRLVRSQCLSYDRFIEYILAIHYSDTEYLYISLDDLNGSILANGQNALVYDFTPGDRMRFLRLMQPMASFPAAPQFPNIEAEILTVVKDPTISGTPRTGNFIKIRNSANVAAAIGLSTYKVEIYSPSTIPAKQFFFEFGDTNTVLNPGTATRAHGVVGGTNQDVTLNIPASLTMDNTYGDVYVKRYNKMSATYVGGVVATVYDFYTSPVQDMNFNQAYKSALTGNGRALIVDATSGQRHYPNLVRFGGQYLQGTNINNTNIFYPQDFDEYDRDYGSIKRMRARDREVRIFQELKTGRVPVYQQVIQDAAGNDVIAQSDRLINKIQYFSGDYGIGNAPDSLAQNNFSDYFCDTNRHVVVRVSKDGLTPISITNGNNATFTSILPRYTKPTTPGFTPPNYTGDKQGDAPILGAFDALHNEYIMGFTEIASYAPGPIRTVVYPAQTRNWDEVGNRFIGVLSYKPEYIVNIGTQLISFVGGIGYVHDSNTYCNFYGVQYGAHITVVFNKAPNLKKTFLSIDQYSTNVFECPEISTSQGQSSNLIASDFQDFEGHKYASFLYDSSSPNGLLNGDSLKGGWIKVKLQLSTAPSLFKLVTVAVKSIASNENLH